MSEYARNADLPTKRDSAAVATNSRPSTVNLKREIGQIESADISPGLKRDATRKAIQLEESKKRRLEKTRVMVCGRMTSAGIRWDVLKVTGRHVEPYFVGSPWRGEALGMAEHCLSGRVQVSISTARAIVCASKRSGLLVPNRFSDSPAGVSPDARFKFTAKDGLPPEKSMLVEVERT